MAGTADWILEARQAKKERQQAAAEAALPREQKRLARTRSAPKVRRHGRQTR